MLQWGFIPRWSDAVTIGSFFTKPNYSQYFLAAYIVASSAGDIVWENNLGEPQWSPGIQANVPLIIGAQRILSSATVNGNSRTTTASGMVWYSINQLQNSP